MSTKPLASMPDVAASAVISAIPPTDVLRRLASLRAAPTADLKQQWRELFGKEPPAFSRAYLQSRLAHRIQEIVHGGLRPETVARLEALGERLDGGNIMMRRIRADNMPAVGTKLIREFHGVEHVVAVLMDGFEYNGRRYRSLSAIARTITKVRWNGPAFFGLRGRGSS